MSDSDPIKELIAGTAPEIGVSFFNTFIEHLAKAYGAEYAIANQLINTQPVTVRTLAFWKNGEVAENFEYKVETTPCEMVYKNDTAYFPSDIQQIFNKDTDLIHMDVNSYLGTVLKSHDGEVIGHICVLGKNDVASYNNASEILKVFSARASAELERLKMEQEIIQHRDKLKELVDEKTKDLKLAQRKAEHASKAKSEFMSRMSHELRTPLNAIIGYAEILQDDLGNTISSVQNDQFDTILFSSWNLLNLIQDVLDLSKLEAGELSEGVQKADVNPMIDECVVNIQAEAKKKDIVVTLDTGASENIRVQCNLNRFTQVLNNLLSNAIKFNKQNGTIKVTTEHSNSRIRISISDSGSGLDEQDKSMVFDKFERLESSDKNCIPGTGIGLAITKRLVEHMGGDIGVNSNADVGSTFWVELPTV